MLRLRRGAPKSARRVGAGVVRDAPWSTLEKKALRQTWDSDQFQPFHCPERALVRLPREARAFLGGECAVRCGRRKVVRDCTGACPIPPATLARHRLRASSKPRKIAVAGLAGEASGTARLDPCPDGLPPWWTGP